MIDHYDRQKYARVPRGPSASQRRNGTQRLLQRLRSTVALHADVAMADMLWRRLRALFADVGVGGSQSVSVAWRRFAEVDGVGECRRMHVLAYAQSVGHAMCRAIVPVKV